MVLVSFSTEKFWSFPGQDVLRKKHCGNTEGPFTLRISVSLMATLPLKNQAGFNFASVLANILSVLTYTLLLPMDNTGDITLD